MPKLKNKGFLFLEVMIAVAVLSIGLTLVLRSFVTSLRAIQTADNLSVAKLLLEEKIWQKQEEKQRLSAVEIVPEQGKFDSPLDNFSYRIEFQEEEELVLLYQSTFEVSWQQRAREHAVTCWTYFPGIE